MRKQRVAGTFPIRPFRIGRRHIPQSKQGTQQFPAINSRLAGLCIQQAGKTKQPCGCVHFALAGLALGLRGSLAFSV